MRTIVPLIVFATLIAGCEAPIADSGAATAAPPSDAASPPAAEVPVDDTVYAEGEPRWMLSADTDDKFLAFAVPESDDVRFSLSCGRGERTLRLWRESLEDDEPTFQLASGDVTTSYPGEVDPEGMAPQLNGVAPARAPVFVAFRTTGNLILTVRGEAHDLSAPAGALPMIAAFFDHCGPSDT